jgi:tRNA pseudouridine13 synthase
MLIKQVPEDFIVEEVPVVFSESGNYAIYRLTKRNYTTESAVAAVCKRLNIRRKDIKYAGNKDRNALTVQYISIFNYRKDSKFDSPDLKLEFITYHHDPLSLGSLLGNKFIITVRDVSDENSHIIVPEFLPNYYDEQRFSKNNFDIGLALLKKDYKKAVELNDDEDVKNYISKHPTDYIGALRKIPTKILSIYIHSVQSFIFNEALYRMVKDKRQIQQISWSEADYSLGKFLFAGYHDDSKLPLVGFDTVPEGKIKEIMDNLGIKPSDFITRAIPELTTEQSFRECFMKIGDFSHEWKEKDCILKFFLPKGSYATIVLKALFPLTTQES